MTAELTVGAVVRAYISALKPIERPTIAPELQRFSRWFGSDRLLDDVSPSKLDEYQDHMSASGLDPAGRLEPLRQFLSYARAKRLISQPLAVHVRIRRRSSKDANANRVTEPVKTVEMTQSGHEQLTAELERLESEERPRAVAAIARARADGDLRENAPYHAAREHAGDVDRKINEIRESLKHAVIVSKATGDRAALGTTVVLHDLMDGEELVYMLVGPGEVDRRNGKISVRSPVGSALIDRVVGDTVEVVAPAGVNKYRLVRIDRAP